MKLPELKEKLKSKYIVRVVAGVLTIALVGTGIGATAVFAEKNSTAVTAEADSTTGSSKDADDIADKLMDSVSLKDNDADKDESVYLISDANGNVNKTIVVDHLKNKDKKDTLEDASNLTDIENVKGKEKFTQSGDKLTWQAGGKDIYYQGTATEEPPVTQKVTYYLDGKEISPEDLAGKSGKVKIRFDYTNTTSYTETVNGEKQTVSVPFAAITGLVLGDGFENIEVTNGKAEVSNSSSVVLGYALPGLKDSLGIKDGDLDGDVNIPEYMEMTADVENFSMPAAMTFVVNASDYVSTDGIDTSDLDDMINDLKDASTQLQDGSKTLAEGTDTLADGLSTLQSKLGTFASGVGTLQSGLKTYTDGVSTLSGGLNTLGNSTGALVSGADKLNSGAGQLASGSATLKDATNEAIRTWAERAEDTFYIIGSAVGPHPYPKMVKEFQRIISTEARRQILEKEGRLPDAVVACVGGGSNSIGMFADFIDDKDVKLIGVEAGGLGIDTGNHASAMALGEPGVLHGMKSYLLQDEAGNIKLAHSISAGLDYPGVGPEHAYLRDSGRAEYVSITDAECMDALMELCRMEGIIPAIESAHALAHVFKMAQGEYKGKIIVMCLSGRGDKDVHTVKKYLNGEETNK